jgi:hypothetical protein
MLESCARLDLASTLASLTQLSRRPSGQEQLCAHLRSATASSSSAVSQWTPTLFYKLPNGTYQILGGESRVRCHARTRGMNNTARKVYYETLLPIGDGTRAVQTEPFPYDFQCARSLMSRWQG